MSTMVTAAKTRKRLPPAYCSTRSDRYLLSTEPPTTAIPVATPCPLTAPSTTPSGDDAAESAMVAKKDLSPHSAAKTKANVDSKSPDVLPGQFAASMSQSDDETVKEAQQ